MKIDLDEIEQHAREWSAEDAEWYPGVGPAVTLALIARIRELEASGNEVVDECSARVAALPARVRGSVAELRRIIERGAVLP